MGPLQGFGQPDQARGRLQVGGHSIQGPISGNGLRRRSQRRRTALGDDWKDEEGRYILVVHTFQETEPNQASVRIISARRPTKTEIAQYEQTYQ